MGNMGYDKYIVFISKGESKLERSSLLRTENQSDGSVCTYEYSW